MGTPAYSLGAAPRSYTDAETTARISAVSAEATARAAADALRLLLTGGTLSGALTAPVYLTTVYTVGTLPAATVGSRAFVSDALAPVFGAVVAGAGAVNIPVYADGAAWRVG